MQPLFKLHFEFLGLGRVVDQICLNLLVLPIVDCAEIEKVILRPSLIY